MGNVFQYGWKTFPNRKGNVSKCAWLTVRLGNITQWEVDKIPLGKLERKMFQVGLGNVSLEEC